MAGLGSYNKRDDTILNGSKNWEKNIFTFDLWSGGGMLAILDNKDLRRVMHD